MVCFGFLNPQVVRLMLDRTKFEGIVVPAAGRTPRNSMEFYKASVTKKHKQTPVFIFPDFQTLSAVLRSGFFEAEKCKYILCAAASDLEEHGLDPYDATFKGAVWQVRNTMSATMNTKIEESTIDADLIALLTKKVERPEHLFSNAKVAKDAVIVKPVDIRDAFKALGDKATSEGEIALLKFLVYGFVAKAASKLGKTIEEIVPAAEKTLRAQNKEIFAAYVRSKKIPMTKEAAKIVYDMQKTSVPKVALRFAWKAIVSKRPESIVCAETGCDASLGALLARHLTSADFPVSADYLKNPERVIAHNAVCTVIPIKRGWYEMITLIKAAGFTGSDQTDILSKSQQPVRFSRNPRWHNQANWWPVGVDEGKPLGMIFANRKFRFEPIRK